MAHAALNTPHIPLAGPEALFNHANRSKRVSQTKKKGATTLLCNKHGAGFVGSEQNCGELSSSSQISRCIPLPCGARALCSNASLNKVSREASQGRRAVQNHATKNKTSGSGYSSSAGTSAPADSPQQSRGGGGGGEVLVTAEGLAKTFDGVRWLFEDLTLSVTRGQKVGLIGANGCGKSTLLRVLARSEAPDRGTVQWRKGINIGYLAQEPALDDEMRVLDAVLAADTPVMAAVREYERCLVEAPGGAALQAAMNHIDTLQAWDVASEAERVLSILGVGFLDRKVGALSGGQRKRVAMAATLLAKPDLVILDEPTNHMDREVIEWMERMLDDSSVTALFVTHDRYFLDKVSTDVLELEGGKGYRHPGNYSAYLAGRAARLAAAEAEISRAETTLRRESEWMSRQPKARSTKSRSRIDRFYALTKKAERGRNVQQLDLEVGESRLGGKVLALQDASFAWEGGTILDGFTYEFGRGERVGLVGRNGVGKSTLLDALAGLLPLDSGVREAGETLVVGYYTQQTPPIPEDMRVIDYVRQFGEKVQLGGEMAGGFQGQLANTEMLQVSSFLERFGFPRQRQYEWAGRLSGGERRRLYLATILMRRPNFLILDEPTNDLDLPTIQVLENFLLSYEGCLLVASHDRAFMDAVSQRLFVMEGDGQVRLFQGTYSDYLEEMREREKEANSDFQSTPSTSGRSASAGQMPQQGTQSEEAQDAKKARKLSYLEKKEFEGLEREIEKLGVKKMECEMELERLSSSADYVALAAVSERLTTLMATIDAKTERWMELADLAES